MAEFLKRPMEERERAWCAKSWVESYSASVMAKLISGKGNIPEVRLLSEIASCLSVENATAEEVLHEVQKLVNQVVGWSAEFEYRRTWNTLVNQLLDECTCTVMIDDMNLIAGFVCWEPWESFTAVHYVYVRQMYRKQGVAKALIRDLPQGRVYYTHRSRGIYKVPSGWEFSLRPLFNIDREKEAS